MRKYCIYCIYCIYCNGYLYLYIYIYMYLSYLLRWVDSAFYFWSKVEEIEFHGLLGVGHIQRHHFRRLSMVFISDHPWLIIYNVLSIHGWSKVKPVKNDDVIHEQPLIQSDTASLCLVGVFFWWSITCPQGKASCQIFSNFFMVEIWLNFVLKIIYPKAVRAI